MWPCRRTWDLSASNSCIVCGRLPCVLAKRFGHADGDIFIAISSIHARPFGLTVKFPKLRARLMSVSKRDKLASIVSWANLENVIKSKIERMLLSSLSGEN